MIVAIHARKPTDHTGVGVFNVANEQALLRLFASLATLRELGGVMGLQ
jgi:hypothetical protein